MSKFEIGDLVYYEKDLARVIPVEVATANMGQVVIDIIATAPSDCDLVGVEFLSPTQMWSYSIDPVDGGGVIEDSIGTFHVYEASELVLKEVYEAPLYRLCAEED